MEFSSVENFINSTEEIYNLSKCRIKQANSFFSEGRFNEAVEACDKILESSGKQWFSLPALYLKGSSLMSLKKFDSALSLLRRGLREQEEAPLMIEDESGVFSSKPLESCLLPFREAMELPSSSSRSYKSPTPKSSTLRSDWTQNSEIVFINIYVKNLQAEDCRVSFNAESVDFEALSSAEGSSERLNQSYHIHQLFEEISPCSSSFKVYKTKVELLLAKAKKGIMWASLSKDNEKLQLLAGSAGSLEAAKTGGSSSSGVSPTRKDWDAISKSIDENNELSGEESVETMFREIFAKGDADTRRAMIKSFQTSGGTILSTNWNDVKETDYEKEIVPPEGQVLKKWY